MLKLAAEDVKAYYFESLTAQPGPTPDSRALADWFWGETRAGELIGRCAGSLSTERRKGLTAPGQTPAGPAQPSAPLHRPELAGIMILARAPLECSTAAARPREVPVSFTVNSRQGDGAADSAPKRAGTYDGEAFTVGAGCPSL